MGMFFAWLHRAWLCVAIVFMLAAGFAWLEVNVSYRAQAIEQLCGYRDAIEMEDGLTDTINTMLKNMRTICTTGMPEDY